MAQDTATEGDRYQRVLITQRNSEGHKVVQFKRSAVPPHAVFLDSISGHAPLKVKSSVIEEVKSFSRLKEERCLLVHLRLSAAVCCLPSSCWSLQVSLSRVWNRKPVHSASVFATVKLQEWICDNTAVLYFLVFWKCLSVCVHGYFKTCAKS